MINSAAAWKPKNNHLLVSIPERFESTAVPGKPRLYLPSGSDDWASLTDELKAGRGMSVETDQAAAQTAVRQGTVLAVPERLTDDMLLNASPWTTTIDRYVGVTDDQGKRVKRPNGEVAFKREGYQETPVYRTAADITERARVGDTIHLEHTCLTDEAEIMPGVYLVPYSAVIARLACRVREDMPALTAEIIPEPLAGYILLRRVWADDVQEAEIEGRTCKVRYAKGLPQLIDITSIQDSTRQVVAERMIAEIDVPPLPNEGVVAWVGSPIVGQGEQVRVGERAVFHGYKAHDDKSHPLSTGPALVETIAGTEYLCVRQDFIFAIRPDNGSA